jgi:hypothetical protein
MVIEKFDGVASYVWSNRLSQFNRCHVRNCDESVLWTKIYQNHLELLTSRWLSLSLRENRG